MTEEEEGLSRLIEIRDELERLYRANQMLVQGVLDSMIVLKSSCENAARTMKGEPLPH